MWCLGTLFYIQENCWFNVSNIILKKYIYSIFLFFLAGMHFQDWLRSLVTCAELKGTDSENTGNLWPSLPSLSSFALSRCSLLGLGAVASLAAYYLLMRPRPMRPPCDLQVQSVAVNVSESQLLCAEMEWKHPTVLMLHVCVQGDPTCRRSALLKDDLLLEFYYEDTRTYYDMFQRGLNITGRERRDLIRHKSDSYGQK